MFPGHSRCRRGTPTATSSSNRNVLVTPNRRSIPSNAGVSFLHRMYVLSVLFLSVQVKNRKENEGASAFFPRIRRLLLLGLQLVGCLPLTANAFEMTRLPMATRRKQKNQKQSQHQFWKLSTPYQEACERHKLAMRWVLYSSAKANGEVNNYPVESQTPTADASLFWPVPPPLPTKLGKLDANNDDEEEEDVIAAVFDSIIKIHASHTEPSWTMPWQKKHQSTSTSSGFCISEERIMTNAHSVEYASLVQVQKRGQSQKYRAVVEAIANDCDLAILKVVQEKDVPSFWGSSDDETAIVPLEFGTLPELQEEVEVLGYPTGGDAMSVTSGVVSRIEMQEYAQSGQYLLAMQIDAAINPGNSGGPVVDAEQGNKVVGVAFQTLDQAENIGYVVPVSVVQHFLEDIRRHGRYTGFCSLGARMALLENPAQRRLLQLDRVKNGIKEHGADVGVMISSLNPISYAKQYLQPRDVILSVDNIPIAKDAKIPFRPGERVSLGCYMQTKFLGDTVQMEILRKGQCQTLSIPVSMTYDLVPSHFHNQPPPYLLMGGFVFTVLSVPYLHALDAFEDFVSDDISYLLTLWRHDPEPPPLLPDDNNSKRSGAVPDISDNQEVVILTQVLIHSSNLGYEHLSDIVLEKVNGHTVRSLQHLHTIVQEECDKDGVHFLELQFAPNERLVVLETSSIVQATNEICEEHNIQKPYLFHN